MKNISILLALLLFVYAVNAQQFSIDDSNRVVALPFVKGQVLSYTFYGDSYSIELGGFDFEHNRVTVEMHPQLGTDIVNLNVATNWDLDLDEEDDIAVTVVSLDPNAGSNVNGEVGTAVLRIESLKPIPLEPTTVTTKETTSTVTTVTAAATVDTKSRFGGTTTWIIVGIVVGVGIILFLLKGKIRGRFGRGEAEAGQQQVPSNYKPAKAAAGSMKCQKCGREMQPGTKFCNNCGAKVVAGGKKFCPECGREFKGGKFCQNCGHKMV